jgi:hypothetical protein
MNNVAYEYSCIDFCVDICFHFSWVHHRARIAVSYHNFNFVRSYQVVLQDGCLAVHFIFPYMSSNVCTSLLMLAVLIVAS